MAQRRPKVAILGSRICPPQTRSLVDEPAGRLPPDKSPGLLEQASSKTRAPILVSPPLITKGGVTKKKSVLAQDLDEPCAGKSRAVLCGFYGVHTDKIYRRIGGFRVVVMQKHAKTRSKCHFEAIWGPTGQMERRRTSFVYHAWALTTYFEAFVLLVAALAPFIADRRGS